MGGRMHGRVRGGVCRAVLALHGRCETCTVCWVLLVLLVLVALLTLLTVLLLPSPPLLLLLLPSHHPCHRTIHPQACFGLPKLRTIDASFCDALVEPEFTGSCLQVVKL
jgi:hypothetical protein